jgi:1-phosphofructokinase family hexose kinase
MPPHDDHRPGRVLAVCANPALDRIAVVPGAGEGGSRRASTYLDTAGGKAVHVAQVASCLSAETLLLAPLGGARGRRVEALLADAQVPFAGLESVAETRGTYAVLDPERGPILEVLEPGALADPREADALLALVAAHCGPDDVVVAAGSLPLGYPPDFYARVVELAHAAGAFVIVDTAGDPLAAALNASPDLVSPNLSEWTALATERVPHVDPGSPQAAVTELQNMGARSAWITLGADGSVLALPNGDVLQIVALPTVGLWSIGCGDAMLGGFAAGLLEGRAPIEAARLGAAAAADKLRHVGSGTVEATRVRQLARAVVVRSCVAFGRSNARRSS